MLENLDNELLVFSMWLAFRAPLVDERTSRHFASAKFCELFQLSFF
jgi:hypothetical protein